MVVPSIVFMTSLVVALNVLLRNKYLTYVVAVGTGAGLFYLYSIGYNHWLYNPLLYQLWKYQISPARESLRTDFTVSLLPLPVSRSPMSYLNANLNKSRQTGFIWHWGLVVQCEFRTTPKAFANFSPRLELATTLG